MPFLAPLLSSTIGSFLVRLAITFVIGKIQQNAMEKKMKSMQRQQSAVMVNSADNTQPIPVVYGRTRIGGNRAFIETTNGAGNVSNSDHLNIVLAMCEGEIADIRQIWFDDKIVWDITNGGTIDGGGKLGGFISEYSTALNDVHTLFRFHNGESGQTADGDLITSIGSDWTSNHRLRGITYLSIILKANAEVYKGGLPLITAVVQGKKIANVNSLTPGQTSYGTLIWGANQDPVDVLYDYLSNKIYGKGLDHDENGNYNAGLHINIDSFKAAKARHAGYYKINGVIDTSQQVYNNVGEIIESMNGVLVFQNGVYSLQLKHSTESSVYTFTKDVILSEVSVQLPPKEQRYNRMTAQYRNKESGTDYNDDVVVVENGTYLALDNNQKLEGQLRLDLVDSETLVNTLTTYALNASRYNRTVSFTAAHTTLKVECGNIVTLVHEDFGWEAGKLFRVAQMNLTPENTIEFTLIEYVPGIEII